MLVCVSHVVCEMSSPTKEISFGRMDGRLQSANHLTTTPSLFFYGVATTSEHGNISYDK